MNDNENTRARSWLQGGCAASPDDLRYFLRLMIRKAATEANPGLAIAHARRAYERIVTA